jgi:hypothetical protein
MAAEGIRAGNAPVDTASRNNWLATFEVFD